MLRIPSTLPYTFLANPLIRMNQKEITKRGTKLIFRNQIRLKAYNERSFKIVEEREEPGFGHSVMFQGPYAWDIEEFRYERMLFPEISNEEFQFLKTSNASCRRIAQFLGGRLALKSTPEFKKFAPSFNSSIFNSPQGGPIVPANMIASITHKDDLFLAIAKEKEFYPGSNKPIKECIGIDMEHIEYKSTNEIMEKILTENEIKQTKKYQIMSAEKDSMLKFSFKEAVYKALNPMIRRYIGFKEVEICPKANGTAEIFFLLRPGQYNPSVINYTATWREYDDFYFITTVKLQLPMDEKENPFPPEHVLTN